MFLGGGCSLATEPLAALAGRFYKISMVRIRKYMIHSGRVGLYGIIHVCILVPYSGDLVRFLTLGTWAGVTIVVLCVSECVYTCVCYHASYYILHLHVEDKGLLGFLWHFQRYALCEKTLCSKVLVTFADHLCLFDELSNGQMRR